MIKNDILFQTNCLNKFGHDITTLAGDLSDKTSQHYIYTYMLFPFEASQIKNNLEITCLMLFGRFSVIKHYGGEIQYCIGIKSHNHETLLD